MNSYVEGKHTPQVYRCPVLAVPGNGAILKFEHDDPSFECNRNPTSTGRQSEHAFAKLEFSNLVANSVVPYNNLIRWIQGTPTAPN